MSFSHQLTPWTLYPSQAARPELRSNTHATSLVPRSASIASDPPFRCKTQVQFLAADFFLLGCGPSPPRQRAVSDSASRLPHSLKRLATPRCLQALRGQRDARAGSCSCDNVSERFMDSKSIGLCPQGFESPRCRFFYFALLFQSRTRRHASILASMSSRPSESVSAATTCISRESSPGRVDGNDVFCH